jgi:hypothetical protein
MDNAKKYCENYVQQYMRGVYNIEPYESHGELPDQDELKQHTQNFIRTNAFPINLDHVKISYVNLEERFAVDKLETVWCIKVMCCLPYWRKREYNKQVALKPWAIQIAIRKSNVTPIPMLGRASIRI